MGAAGRCLSTPGHSVLLRFGSIMLFAPMRNRPLGRVRIAPSAPGCWPNKRNGGNQQCEDSERTPEDGQHPTGQAVCMPFLGADENQCLTLRSKQRLSGILTAPPRCAADQLLQAGDMGWRSDVAQDHRRDRAAAGDEAGGWGEGALTNWPRGVRAGCCSYRSNTAVPIMAHAATERPSAMAGP